MSAQSATGPDRANDQPRQETPHAQIFAPAEITGKCNLIDTAEFRELRDRFARRSYSLQRVYRADDGRVSFHIMRSSKTCVLSHPHDVRAFLTVVEGSPA